MNRPLTGKTILITGGTSQLGRRFVQKALREGAKVFFTYHRNGTVAQELTREEAQGFVLNLSDFRAMDSFAKEFKEKVKSLDVLVHNAAAVRDGAIKNLTEEDWDYVLDVGLKAPFYLTKKLLPLLFRKKPAKIFTVVSRLAVVGGSGVSNYVAAKAGLIGLTKSLAQELGPKKILVNAINPGFMRSRMTENLPEEVIQRNMEKSPLGRGSDPDEVADFMIYLCSDQMTQVTGQVFHFESRKI